MRTAKQFNSTGLRRAFPGVETITSNFAQADQDIFVLSMLDGKRNGSWLEVGCGWPLHISNTALLEQFAWSGLSIDSYKAILDEWPDKRLTSPIHICGLKADWLELLHQKSITQTNIDYLSLDCDPAEQTLDVLYRIPFDRLKFAVITFEHDSYASGDSVKIASRQYLQSHGYVLVAGNISDWGQARDYEDWWCHPDLVDPALIELYKSDTTKVKPYETYLYGLEWSEQLVQNRL